MDLSYAVWQRAHPPHRTGVPGVRGVDRRYARTRGWGDGCAEGAEEGFGFGGFDDAGEIGASQVVGLGDGVEVGVGGGDGFEKGVEGG